MKESQNERKELRKNNFFYNYENLGICINIVEPSSVGAAGGPGVCPHYPGGKTIQFWIHNNNQAGFSVIGYEQNLTHQLEITENYVSETINKLQNKIKEYEGIYQDLENIEKQAEECLNIAQVDYNKDSTLKQKMNDIINFCKEAMQDLSFRAFKNAPSSLSAFNA
ncbi:4153_t:CDS:2 [Cetraspora pellucida]|uniref:4153_t:CDS:1 n=1 Tax=Cetraspora pellucida TaxID=1433469 RepID=A0ACA9KJ76_9GLOM|nr:4153_t:CDS:2 [Cetraspora pellucida]